ncbi:uncharacterized protein LOC135198120 [Macrobrachium nipponense]|uniref:uncharacterized protein LOC135198120 n=1 Tax=Macrobrachium nipponense TaxID=159736 RepID=UPI0030C7C3B6
MVHEATLHESGDSAVLLEMGPRIKPFADITTNSRVRRSTAPGGFSNGNAPVSHTLRVSGGLNIYLHLSDGVPSLNMPNATGHSDMCIKLHRIILTDRIQAGEIVIMESAEDNKYLSGSRTPSSTSSGVVELVSGEAGSLETVSANDPRLFQISREVGSLSCTIRHKQTGLYLSASGNSLALTTENRTLFEKYRCDHS